MVLTGHWACAAARPCYYQPHSSGLGTRHALLSITHYVLASSLITHHSSLITHHSSLTHSPVSIPGDIVHTVSSSDSGSDSDQPSGDPGRSFFVWHCSLLVSGPS